MTEEFLAQLIEEGIFEWGMVNVIKVSHLTSRAHVSRCFGSSQPVSTFLAIPS